MVEVEGEEERTSRSGLAGVRGLVWVWLKYGCITAPLTQESSD